MNTLLLTPGWNMRGHFCLLLYGDDPPQRERKGAAPTSALTDDNMGIWETEMLKASWYVGLVSARPGGHFHLATL